MSVTIYHNPACSKSRKTLALIRSHGIEPVIVEYLKSPPDAETLRTLLSFLGLNAAQLARQKETAWSDAGLSTNSSDADIIAAMVMEPKSIERPIVVCGERAVLGRPPENVNELLAG